MDIEDSRVNFPIGDGSKRTCFIGLSYSMQSAKGA